MATVQLDPNIPFKMSVKWADVVSGKYGAQVRFKGSAPTEPDAVVYVDHVPAMNALVACGAIPGVPDYDPDNLPPRGFAVTLAKKELTFTKVQHAGEKKGQIHISNGTPPTAAATPVATAQSVYAGNAATHVAPHGGGSYAMPAPGPVAGALPVRNEFEALGAEYALCVDEVIAQILPKIRVQGLAITGDTVASVSATLFIEKQKRGR